MGRAPAFYSVQQGIGVGGISHESTHEGLVIGLLFVAAIFATIPISPQVTQRGVEVSVDQAQAITYGRNRRVNRRLLRRGAALTPLAAALSPWAYRRAGYAAPAGYYYYGDYGAPSYYYGSYGAYFGQPVGGGGGEMYRGGGYYGPPAYYRR